MVNLFFRPHFINAHPGSITPGNVEFMIDTAWRTDDFYYEAIRLDFGDNGTDTTVYTSASSAFGNFTDAACQSYTLYKNKITQPMLLLLCLILQAFKVAAAF